MFSFLCNCSYAQEDNYDINGFSIGIVPSAFINVRNGFQAEVNYGLEDHFEISINGGFLYGMQKNNSYDGYRFKPSVKYYLLNDFEENRFYIEVGYIKRVTYENFLATYNMFQGSFIQDLVNKRTRTVDGAYAMYGSRQTINNSNFYLDYGVGAGLGSITIITDTVENAEVISDPGFYSNNNDGTRPFPIILIHLVIGYEF